ncbi:MAG: hypothetical protein KF768_05530 [Phycisphaeraceae bacterium]|nr:hypothetical protein [Phycisphaeraceae bacterium]
MSNPIGPSWYQRNYFLLRRLHSLTGIVPIGVFLIAHLVTNSSILWGKFALRGDGAGKSLIDGGVYYFAKEVTWINEQVPHLLLIEITLWVSIAFHSILGVVYAMSGKSNTSRYAYQDNWRYTLQRVSGYVGIAFIFYHVATLRWGWKFLVPGGTQWSHHYSASTLALALRGSAEGMTTWGLLVSLFYMLGVTMLVFHFANGLWTAAITWGVTVSANAQRRWGRVCTGIGAALMLAGWSSVIGFAMLSPEAARAQENKLLGKSAHAVPESSSSEVPARPE